MHQLGGITPPPSWCNAPLSGVTPLRNKLNRGKCLAVHTARPDCGAHGQRQGLAGLRDDAPVPCCLEGAVWTAEPGRGARGRQQGLAGLRDDTPIPCCPEGAGGTAWTTGPGRGARGRRQGLAGLRDDTPIPCCLEGTGGTAWTTEPGRGARGRRQGLAGLRDRPLRAAGSRVAISRAGRRPRAPTSRQALTAWRPRS